MDAEFAEGLLVDLPRLRAVRGGQNVGCVDMGQVGSAYALVGAGVRVPPDVLTAEPVAAEPSLSLVHCGQSHGPCTEYDSANSSRMLPK